LLHRIELQAINEELPFHERKNSKREEELQSVNEESSL